MAGDGGSDGGRGSRRVCLAAVQYAMSENMAQDLDKAEKLVREAACRGANIIVLPVSATAAKQFEFRYFPQAEDPSKFELARPFEDNPTLSRCAGLAAELGVVLLLSHFERAGQAFFNSLAVADADGSIVQNYRKHHIPDNPGYYEKYYFSPRAHPSSLPRHTRFGRLGCLVCWDQWFPVAARAMVLQGAEVLLYPSCIGSEPSDPDHNSYPHWVRVQQGHAAANNVPLVAANRIGHEAAGQTEMTFHGGSFIVGPEGQVVAQEEAVATASFDLREVAAFRAQWALFRDRRPDRYQPLLTLDGRQPCS
ncbi:hypothetical protein ABPG75_003937 [Micractinium tetrahymenae]